MSSEVFISHILGEAANDYRRTLSYSEPWGAKPRDNNIIAERNLSFHISRSFTKVFGDGIALFERRFTPNGASPGFLDAYLFASQLALMLEVKTFFDKPEIDGILNDIHRVHPDHAIQHHMAHSNVTPIETRGLVVVETWKDNHRKWWTQSGNENYGFNPKHTESIMYLKNNAKWRFGEIIIGQYPVPIDENNSRTDTCAWLYCYSPAITSAG